MPIDPFFYSLPVLAVCAAIGIYSWQQEQKAAHKAMNDQREAERIDVLRDQEWEARRKAAKKARKAEAATRLKGDGVRPRPGAPVARPR